MPAGTAQFAWPSEDWKIWEAYVMSHEKFRKKQWMAGYILLFQDVSPRLPQVPGFGIIILKYKSLAPFL